MVGTIFYMHENGVCLLDLKPEQSFFQTKEAWEENTLEVIVMCLSGTLTFGQVLTSKAGTYYYVAPQVLSAKYDQWGNLWSCIVMMYVPLCGYLPFFGGKNVDLLAKVQSWNFSFNPDRKNISDDSKKLMRTLLKMNPKGRYNAQQTLNPEWIAQWAPKAADVSLQGGLSVTSGASVGKTSSRKSRSRSS